MDVIRRIWNRKDLFNQNYFETIDTFDKAYFLGLLMADGYVNHKYIKLSLQEDDKPILEKFKSIVNSNREFYFTDKRRIKKKSKNQFVFALYSVKMVRDLEKYGVIKAKSHKTYFPNIPEEFYSHFIRGVFDGDGCLTISKKGDAQFYIIGNDLLIKKIQEILMKECNLKETKLKHDKLHKDNTISIAYGGNRQIERIGNYLYQSCEDLFLARKKEKFDKIKNRINRQTISKETLEY